MCFTILAAGWSTAMCFKMVAPSFVIIVVFSVWIILSMPLGPRLERMASATPTGKKKKLAPTRWDFEVWEGGCAFCGGDVRAADFLGFLLVLETTAVAAWCSCCHGDEKGETGSEEVLWWWSRCTENCVQAWNFLATGMDEFNTPEPANIT